jgi:pimeloyl-ACP methyl ester carboxylesterase
MLGRTPEQNLRYPLLLIHGLFSSSRTWEKTVTAFIEEYDLRYGGQISAAVLKDAKHNIAAGDFYTWNFSDSRNLSYREQAQELQVAVHGLKQVNKTDKVILAGHSMGGLAARALVQFYNADDIFALITLGTPHYGSPLALLRDSTHHGARKIFSGLHRALARAEYRGEKPPGFFRRLFLKLFSVTSEAEAELDRFFGSEAFAELMPASTALEELNSAPLPANIHYAFITGSVTDFSAFRDSEALLRYKKLTKLWIQFTASAVKSLNNRYLDEPYKVFREYLSRYMPGTEKLTNEQLTDFDGAVPVFSQVLNHFKTPPVLKAVLPVFASHTRLTKRHAKLFQALAVVGAVGVQNNAGKP